jgi:hypothetical protein
MIYASLIFFVLCIIAIFVLRSMTKRDKRKAIVDNYLDQVAAQITEQYKDVTEETWFTVTGQGWTVDGEKRESSNFVVKPIYQKQ